MSVRVILFDVMDTLLADPFREALRAATEVPLDEVFARRAPDLWPAFERGEITEDEYWSGWDAAGVPFDADAFHRVRRANTNWLPGMPQLLDALEGVVHRVAASNYPVWIEEVSTVHLTGRLDRVLASHHLGVRKPDAAFYERLLDAADIAPHEALFVDDRDVNVEAAERLGIASHRFVDAGSLTAWLRGHDIAVAHDRHDGAR